MPNILSCVAEKGKSNIEIVLDLLKMGYEVGVEELQRLGADFTRPGWDGESSITAMVNWGFVSLVEKAGSEVFKINGAWIKETEITDMNLPGILRPILPTACERAVPNLNTIKVLVEKLGVDFNRLDEANSSSCSLTRISVLHIFARATY